MRNGEWRFSILHVSILLVAMFILWLDSEMWGSSLWVNETDTLSYARHGISGFGHGYGAYVFTLHILLSSFGEVDLAFRGLSYASSIITMILIYKFSSGIYRSNATGFIASFIFLYSSYSIEFGMQVRDYAVHSMILMIIAYWLFVVSESPANNKEKYAKSGVFASIGVWYVSAHWFCQIFLILLFTIFCIPYIAKRFGMKNKGPGRFPKTVLPPIITMTIITLSQAISMIEGVSNSADGKHHLGGGSVPLVIMPPIDFLSVILSDSIFLLMLFAISASYSLVKTKKEFEKGEILFETILVYSIPIVWVVLCISQYFLYGLIVERYFYFWFPLICVYSGGAFSMISNKIPENGILWENVGKTLPLIFIFLIASTSKIVPDSSVYGNMRGGFDMIDEEVRGEDFSIISRPPQHILDYYLIQYNLQPEIVIGAWHSDELNRSAINNLETDIVVVISLQSGWILEESAPILEESGYILDEERIFYESGDTMWLWKK